MMFIEYPKCTTCQKAKKWLEKNQILTEEEKLCFLESDGMLLKRPIVITSTNILIGFNEKNWNILLIEEEKTK